MGQIPLMVRFYDEGGRSFTGLHTVEVWGRRRGQTGGQRRFARRTLSRPGSSVEVTAPGDIDPPTLTVKAWTTRADFPDWLRLDNLRALLVEGRAYAAIRSIGLDPPIYGENVVTIALSDPSTWRTSFHLQVDTREFNVRGELELRGELSGSQQGTLRVGIRLLENLGVVESEEEGVLEVVRGIAGELGLAGTTSVETRIRLTFVQPRYAEERISG